MSDVVLAVDPAALARAGRVALDRSQRLADAATGLAPLVHDGVGEPRLDGVLAEAHRTLVEQVLAHAARLADLGLGLLAASAAYAAADGQGGRDGPP